jgi:hypothetical protein
MQSALRNQVETVDMVRDMMLKCNFVSEFRKIGRPIEPDGVKQLSEKLEEQFLVVGDENKGLDCHQSL